jgi:hypothetical protein
MYANIYAYESLHISEMNDGNDIRDRKEELELFVAIRYSHYTPITVLFDNELGLVVN